MGSGDDAVGPQGHVTHVRRVGQHRDHEVDLHIKDLTNALETSHGLGVPLPLSASVLEMMTALKADGHGKDDHSGLVQYYELLARTQVTDGA